MNIEQIFSDGKLTIRQYNRSDEGEYWCSATNIIGETFDIINLLTGSAPTFSDDRIYVQGLTSVLNILILKLLRLRLTKKKKKCKIILVIKEIN